MQHTMGSLNTNKHQVPHAAIRAVVALNATAAASREDSAHLADPFTNGSATAPAPSSMIRDWESFDQRLIGSDAIRAAVDVFCSNMWQDSRLSCFCRAVCSKTIYANKVQARRNTWGQDDRIPVMLVPQMMV